MAYPRNEPGVVLVASILGGLFLSGATSLQLMAQAAPQNTSPSPEADAQAAKREAWRKAMARVPMPKNGCFDASYPSTEWHEVPCLRPSPYPNSPRSKPNAEGNASGEFPARTTGLITSAAGSPDSVAGSTSVPGDGVSCSLGPWISGVTWLVWR
jgi:hypothetical protein